MLVSTKPYGETVKERLIAEGKDPGAYTPSERKWGVRINDTPLIEHKGEVYLEVIVLDPGVTTYLVDGVETAKEDVNGLPTTKPTPAKQGGLEDKIILRTIKLSNIRRFQPIELKVA